MKTRKEHDEVIIDYKKVLLYMDNLPYPNNGRLDSGNNQESGSLKDNFGSLNNKKGEENESFGSLGSENNKESGSLKDNFGSLNSNETDQSDPIDLVDTRKKRILNTIKNNPETTIEALSSSLSIPVRTIYREIEWLKENGFLERIGSKRFGRWNVIKEMK